MDFRVQLGAANRSGNVCLSEKKVILKNYTVKATWGAVEKAGKRAMSFLFTHPVDTEQQHSFGVMFLDNVSPKTTLHRTSALYLCLETLERLSAI